MANKEFQFEAKLDTSEFSAGSEQLLRISQQTTAQMQTHWTQWSNTVQRSITGLVRGTETFGQAWNKLLSSMVADFASGLARMLAQWVEHHAIQLAVHAASKQAEVATDSAASAQKRSISLEESIKEITHAAARAAANAFNAVVGIPVVGPVLAPPAAAAAFAAVEAFGALTSAAGGWWQVDADQLAYVHKNEMVLPAGYASGLRQMIDSGNSSSVQVHVHHTVNAIDAASFQDSVRRHGNIIGNEVARVLKKKGLAG